MVTKNQEERIQRIEDVRAIKNLVAKYSYYYTAGRYDDIIGMFAQKTEGVRITVSDLGTWEGVAGLERYYTGYLRQCDGDRLGQLSVHAYTVPVIEVAGDGKTAKSVWVCHGVIAGKVAYSKFEAGWNWAKIAQDFVKEDGKWKFWHVHIYHLVYGTLENGWAELKRRYTPSVPEEYKPDIAGTKDYFYTSTSGPVYIPVPPDPYEIFDEKTAY